MSRGLSTDLGVPTIDINDGGEVVGMTGFEPVTSRLSAGCSSQTKLHALEQTRREAYPF